MLIEYAGWYFQVYIFVHLLRRAPSALLTLTDGTKTFFLGESGTIVFVRISAASAPLCPSLAGAGMLHTKAFEFGRCSPPLMWEM